jgi:hypothetical protein
MGSAILAIRFGIKTELIQLIRHRHQMKRHKRFYVDDLRNTIQIQCVSVALNGVTSVLSNGIEIF